MKMTAQQESSETATRMRINGDSLPAEANPEVGTSPVVNSTSENQMGTEEAPDLDHNASIGHLATPAEHKTSAVHIASASASESHNTPHHPEQKEVTASTHETDKNSASRTGTEETSISEPYPSETTHHPSEGAVRDGLISTPQVPSEPTVRTSTTMADIEPKEDAHSLNDVSHTGGLRSTVESSPGEPLQLDERLNHGEPNLATSPAPAPWGENLLNPHLATPTSQSPTVPAVEPEQPKDFDEIETNVPVVDNATQLSNLTSVSREPSKIEASADTSMDEMEPIREALPKSETSVAETPAAAIAAINNAAAEMDHIMEQHNLNSNFEIEHTSDRKGPKSFSQADHDSEKGSCDLPQQHDRAAPASVNNVSFAMDPTSTVQETLSPHTCLDTDEPVENEAFRISPSLDHPRLEIRDPTDDQVSHVTHQTLGVHEPMEDQAYQATNSPLNVHEPTASHFGTETSAAQGPPVISATSNVPESIAPYTGIGTPVDSIPADAEMDDGSSVSTVQAYLGAHAPSLGTGSVNGDFDDTHMDDGDSALGDDVESYV